MRKTTIAKLLILALLIALLPTSAFATPSWGDMESQSGAYTISGDTFTVQADSGTSIKGVYSLNYDTGWIKPAVAGTASTYKISFDSSAKIDHVAVGVTVGEIDFSNLSLDNNGAIIVPSGITMSGSISGAYVITADAGTGAYFTNFGSDVTSVTVYLSQTDTNVADLLKTTVLDPTGSGGWISWVDDLGNSWTNGYTLSPDVSVYKIHGTWGSGNSSSTDSGAAGGGGGGGGAAGGSTEVATTNTTSGDTVTVAATTAAVNTAIAAAESDQPVVIDVSDAGANVTTVTVPTTVLSTIESSTGCDGVTLEMPEGDVTLNDDALAEILKDASGTTISITLDVDTVDNALDAAQKEAVEGLVTGEVITATVKSGDVVIDDFGVGRVTITVPFTPPANRPGDKFQVYHVPETGELERHQTTFANGKLSFVTTHFSDFVTIFEPFTDSTATDWYAQYLTYVYDNKLMNGMGNDEFQPETSMNRAMMAQVLFNLSKGTNTADAGFTDVPASEWFANAINWAKNENVTSGANADGTAYEPYALMTREQMVRFMYNYAKAMGKDVSATTNLDEYGDAASVSVWAAEAMQWAVASGMINGISGNLEPQTVTNRAMLATVMTRFAQAMA